MAKLTLRVISSHDNSNGHILLSLSLLVCSIIITLGLAELVLATLLPQNLSGSWLRYGERGYSINKAEGTAVHRANSIEVEYRFNEYHLRGPALDRSAFKVLALGDSFTFGWLLAEEETFLYKLQNMASRALRPKKIQFLNGGVGGWGTAHQLAFLEEFGAGIAPDLILVFMNVDDIGRSLRSGLYTFKAPQGLELEAQTLEKSGLKLFLNQSALYQWVLSNSHLLQFIRKAFVQLRFSQKAQHAKESHIAVPASPNLHVGNDKALRMGQALFHRMHRWCQEHSIPLIVTNTGWFTSSDPNEATSAFLNKAVEVFAGENIDYVDNIPAVQEALGTMKDEEIALEGDGHPTAQATSVIAEMTWAWLGPILQKLSD